MGSQQLASSIKVRSSPSDKEPTTTCPTPDPIFLFSRENLLYQFESGKEHGPWLINELDHVNKDSSLASLGWLDPCFLAPAKILSPVAIKDLYGVVPKA